MKGQKVNLGDSILINLYEGYGNRQLRNGEIVEIHEDKKDFFKAKIEGVGKVDKWFNTCHSNVMLVN